LKCTKHGNMNFLELQKKFPNELAIVKYFIEIRYKGSIGCHHCGSIHVYHRQDKPKVYQCMDCNNSFSVFKDTIFENSSTALIKWMYAIHLFLNGKKGISGLQLMREIGVTYKTAWRMLNQIRKAMGNKGD
jgi:transposase-like protein